MAEKDLALLSEMDEESGTMHLIEPSPVEETPAEFKDDYFPPPAAARSTTLGFGNHSPAYYRMCSLVARP